MYFANDNKGQTNNTISATFTTNQYLQYMVYISKKLSTSVTNSINWENSNIIILHKKVTILTILYQTLIRGQTSYNIALFW